MRNMFFLFIVTTILSGCISNSHYTQGAKSMQGRAAKLRPSSELSPWHPLLVRYSRLDTGKSEWKNVGSTILGWPSQLDLTPGRYMIEFRCSGGGSYAFPKIKFFAEEGKTYYSKCFKSTDNEIGVEIKEANLNESGKEQITKRNELDLNGTSERVSLVPSERGQTTISLPKYSNLKSLQKQLPNTDWEDIPVTEELDNKFRSINLEPGEYRYEIFFESLVQSMKGVFKIENGQRLTIHQIMGENQKAIFSWVSLAMPQSKQFNIEKLEMYCKASQAQAAKYPFNIGFASYMLEACEKLASQDNVIGLNGLAYCKLKELGVERDFNAARALYLKAYKAGHLESGVEYYLADTGSGYSEDVLKELAEKGHGWAMGVYAEQLSKKNNPDLGKILKMARDSVNEGYGFSLWTLAYQNYITQDKQKEKLTRSAAWFELYSLDTETFNHYSIDLRGKVRAKTVERLVTRQEVADKIQSILENEVTLENRLIIASESFKPIGIKDTVSISFNDRHQIVLRDFNLLHQLEFVNAKNTRSISLNINGEFESDIDLKFINQNSQYLCLYYDDNEGVMALKPVSQSAWCKGKEANTKPAWSLLEAVEN